MLPKAASLVECSDFDFLKFCRCCAWLCVLSLSNCNAAFPQCPLDRRIAEANLFGYITAIQSCLVKLANLVSFSIGDALARTCLEANARD